MTVNSEVKNVNASGQERVNLQSADAGQLTTVHGLTPELAQAIVARRNQNRFQSIADLLQVTAGAPPAPGQPASPPALSSGPALISESLFEDLADDVTVTDDKLLSGVININTAGLEVLCCLPGVDRNLAQAIISYRQSNGFFKNAGELLKVDGMSRQIFEQLASQITARSETYRILCEGRVRSTGTRQRLQVIVRVGTDEVKTLSYREDDL